MTQGNQPVTEWQPADDNFGERVRDSFARQAVMELIGARITEVRPGHVEIELPYRAELCQQHGFFHAGITSTIGDSAGGYAAFSLFPADASVLTIEYKVNLVAPAHGEKLVAVGRVVRPGRTVTLSEAEVFAHKHGEAKLCAKMLVTLMRLDGRPDAPVSD